MDEKLFAKEYIDHISGEWYACSAYGHEFVDGVCKWCSTTAEENENANALQRVQKRGGV